MAQNDMLKRYLDAGMAFTQMTRSRAEAIVKDLVKAGEVQRDEVSDRIDELVERSRKNTEQLLDLVRKEVSDQLGSLGLATKDDLARLEAKLSGLTTSTDVSGAAATAAPAPAATKAAKATKAPAKKLIVPDAPVGAQTAAKKAAKKATKAPAKKAPAKKSS